MDHSTIRNFNYNFAKEGRLDQMEEFESLLCAFLVSKWLCSCLNRGQVTGQVWTDAANKKDTARANVVGGGLLRESKWVPKVPPWIAPPSPWIAI